MRKLTKIRGTYYCENCYKEKLENNTYVMDDIGAIFCSRDCFEQFYATDNENVTTTRVLSEE
jgi:hypothetical protein